MSTRTTGARRASGWVSCCVGLVLAACTPSSQNNVTLKLPAPKPSRQAVGGTSPVNGVAQFDAIQVDPTSWTGSPSGTGSFTVSATPTLTGGPASIAAVDTSNGATTHYIVIGNFSAAGGYGLAVISDTAWTNGTAVIDGLHKQVLVFDGATGDVLGEATAGSLTLTASGISLGQHVTGSISGSFSMYPAGSSCRSDADCASGELCVSGTCVTAPPPACTSNAQCPAGQVCQAGVCVSPPPPACRTDADCAANQRCQSGACVAAPPPPACRTDADCASNEICQSGVCVAAPNDAGTPGCTSSAQCPSGQVCQSGVCMTPPPPPQCTSSAQCSRGMVCVNGTCTLPPPAGCSQMQGSGSYSGGSGGVAMCSSAGSGAVTLSNGAAYLDDSNGPLSLIVADASGAQKGIVIGLNACPSASGTITIAAGGAVLYDEVAASSDTDLVIMKRTSGGTLTFTTVGSVIAGSFQLGFSGSGTINGSFTVQ